MAEINIDLKKMRNASARLSSNEYMFSNIRRTTSLLRWKLPEEIKKRRDIDGRMEAVLRQIQIAEQLMHEIKTTTNSCISQYMQSENSITNNADRFM